MRDPKLAVVDASVALKWQLDDEEQVQQAISLRDDFYLRGSIKLIAPHLILYEMVNGIATAFRRQRIDSGLAVEAVRNLTALGVDHREVDALRVLQVALEYRLAAYDASYIALAESEACELWTGDRSLYEAVNDRLSWARWIGDYPSGGK